MNSKSKFILRLFIIIFTVSISVTVIPSEVFNIYGLFGEIKSSTVTRENKKKYRGNNINLKKAVLLKE